MQGAFVPLIVATGAFLVVLLWRVRPGARSRRRANREALRDAYARVERARDGAERARALCDTAEAAADRLRRGSAAALFLRAMRADPTSTEVVARAVASIGRRPALLESVLWRRLAMLPWTESVSATGAALHALETLYEGPLRNGVRARAVANARASLDPQARHAPEEPRPT